MNDTRFSVTNYEGITVSCTNERWDTHIVAGHGMMEGNETAVKDTIKDPDIVFESNQNDNREVYFKQSSFSTYDLHTKVIVEYGAGLTNPNNVVGKVVSAWPQKEVRGGIGDVIYTRSQS